MIRLVIVTNIPTPYRNPVYRILSSYKDIDLHVFFCSISEPNRSWQNQDLDFKHSILSSQTNSYIHSNFSIIKKLNKFDPDVVITSGFNPTMLFSWLWSIIKLKKHIPFTDATIHSEEKLTFIHRFVRYVVYKFSDAFLGASEKSKNLYRDYKVDEDNIFKSCLAIDNSRFSHIEENKKEYDLLFCGQFVERKNPLFFADVVIKLNELHPKLKVLLLGNGPLKNECITKLKNHGVKFFDAGFVQHNNISKYYNSAKIFVFPTKNDPWGLVANEALASGLPVMVSKFAGVANELVINGYNGFVISDFELSDWVMNINDLLKNDDFYKRLSRNSTISVQKYTFKNAAHGIYQASKYAHSH